MSALLERREYRSQANAQAGAGKPAGGDAGVGAQTRGATAVAMFWISSLAVGGATFIVLALLSGHLPTGGLAAVSAVLGLSYVLAVPPGAIQLRAAAAAGAPGPALTLRPPRFIFVLAVALVAITPLLAHALRIPAAAVALAGLQLPLSCALGSVRGSLTGRRQLHRASASFAIDALCRLAGGVVLGLVWGASGVAAALVLSAALPLLTVRLRDDGSRTADAAGSTIHYMVAVSVLSLLTNADVLLGPRVLGAGADRYAAAALPAKGIYFALFAVSWLAVSSARGASRRRELLAPVAATLGLGILGAVLLVAARPLLPALLHHGEPALDVLAPLALGMAAAGGTSVVVGMAVAREARWPWAAALAAVLALGAGSLIVHPDAAPLALGVLAAQLVALVGGLRALMRRPTPSVLEPEGAVEQGADIVAFGDQLRRRWRRGSDQFPRHDGAEPPADPRRLPILPLSVASMLIVAACLTQVPGHILADTKLDLFVDPGRFMARSLHLWDGSAAFGQVQNQAVGYLFPMAPFFYGALHMGIPVWVAQRMWLALLLCLAMWGTARVAAALRIGTPSGWVLGGLVYAFSPFFISQLASTSAGVIAGALAPWTLLPLIGAVRHGSARRAAALSGLAVFAMGAVNAVSTLGVLPLPALYLLTRRHSRARTRLLVWWVIAVALACIWWGVALIFQGKWGLNFIHFTETAATTQSTTSGLEVLRGTDAWLNYLHLGFPWVPAGWTLATAPVAIAGTAALAAAGAAGLARAGLPERRFLVLSFAVGVLGVGAAYAGPAAGVGGTEIQRLLGGTLSAFRNTDKFEPVLRLPLALGLAYAVSALRLPRARHVATAVAAALVVVAAALPFWQNRLAASGSFAQVPGYWYRLSDYLNDHAGNGTTLLLPASAFGDYDWGRPMDEPLEPLATSPWAVRDLVPLGGTANTQLLDSIENEIANGQITPHLAEVLGRSGISYVVARNDLNWQAEAAPPPSQVTDALRAAGLREVARFGPEVAANQGLAALAIGKGQARVPALEVFAVGRGTPAPVTTYPQAGAVALSGGPQSLVQLAANGELGSRAVLLARDLPNGRLSSGQRWAVSDDSRRDAKDFGLAMANTSYTLTSHERAPGNSSLQIVPPVPGARQSIAVYRGNIASTTASSYGSWLLQIPELAPGNAFDSDPATAWVPGTVGTSVGQWVQATLTRPQEISHISLRLLEDGSWRPLVHRVTVTTAAGSMTSAVAPDEAVQTVPTRPGPTSFVRVTFAAVSRQTRGGATAGVREITIPGVSATRYVQPPEESSLLSSSATTGIDPTFTFSRQVGQPEDILRRDPEAQLARRIVLPASAKMKVTGTALPTPGAQLDALLTRTRGLRVTASSSWDNLPRWRAGNAVDGSRQTAWIAAPPEGVAANSPAAPGVGGPAVPNTRERVSPVPAVADAHPTLALSWPSARTLSSLRVIPAGGFAAPPTVIRITSAEGTRTVKMAPAGGLVHFRALRTNRITVSFPAVAVRYTQGAAGGRTRLPLGLAELDFPALRSLRIVPLSPAARISLPCGSGPQLSIDGHTLPTRLTARSGDVVAQRGLPFSVCTAQAATRLASGVHWVLGRGGGAFTVTNLTLAPASPVRSAAPAAPRSASVVSWGADKQRVRLGAGPATYLAVHENFNRGWQATLEGRRLTAVRLDGWQQGFAIPAGAGGVVTMVYAPNHGFQIGLAVGAALVVLLIALALLPVRRPWRRETNVVAPAQPASRGWRIAGAVAAVAALAFISWPAVIAVVALLLVARVRPTWLAAVAGLALLAAGVLVAVHVDPFPTDHAATFGPIAQILSAIAVAAVITATFASNEGAAS